MISDGIQFRLVDKIPPIILFSMILSHMMSVKPGHERGFGPSDFNLFCKCLSQLERSSCKIENYIFLYSYSNYSISQKRL